MSELCFFFIQPLATAMIVVWPCRHRKL